MQSDKANHNVQGKALLRACLLLILLLLFIIYLRPQSALAQSATPAAPTTAAPSGGPVGVTVAQFSTFEATIPVNTPVKNPFDPSQLDVTVQFTAPDKTQYVIPAFWMQPYQQSCNQDCAVELLKPEGNPVWRVRFTPNKPGEWAYTVREKDPNNTRTTGSGKFTVTPSANRGFIRVGKNNRYFAYDNGTAYFPVGTNLGWSWNGSNNTLGYQNWLRKLHDSGANYARLYVDVPWFIGLDWKGTAGDFSAEQDDAWRLDAIMRIAEEQGIALQIVLVWYQSFATYSQPPLNVPTSPGRPDMTADWNKNPLNTALGGPLTGATQFFSSDIGKTLFKRRLRYITSRWGYSPSIFAWELLDQADRVAVSGPEVLADWLKESANTLRDLDPYKHLITVGLRDLKQSALLDRAVLDFKEVRFYQRRPVEPAQDQVTATLGLLGPLVGTTDRPLLLNEFSIANWFEPTADDPTGVHVRSTMWASALSGSAGGAASWWWDTYIFPQNLTTIFEPLARFSEGVPWNTAAFTPIEVAVMGSSTSDYAPLKISGYSGTFNAPKGPEITYRITSDGSVPPVTSASAFLYGTTYNNQNAQPHRYIIAPPVDTTLTINIRRVSERAGAKLVVTVDGKIAGELVLPANTANLAMTIALSAGEHAVTLENTGQDYVLLDSMELSQYITQLRAVSLADRTTGIFLSWIQHRAYTWENVTANVEVRPVPATLKVAAMPAGQYQVELWDVFTGNVIGSEVVSVQGNKPGPLTINLLPTSKMIAVRAFRISDPTGSIAPATTPTPKK